MLALLATAALASVPSIKGTEWHLEALRDGGTLYEVALDPRAFKLRPVLVPSLERTSRIVSDLSARGQHPVFAVNGGFFNHRDGVGASYVTIDGTLRSDPHANELLVGNPKLKPYLPEIFNRTEFRVLRGSQGEQWAIASHQAPLKVGERLLDALQAGPRLLPKLGLEREGFVAYGPEDRDGHRPMIRDGIGALQPACRTALGIRPDGWLVLAVAIAPQGKGLTIPDLSDRMRAAGCQEAMALDGGSSTTLVRCRNGTPDTTIAPPEGEARVKSALVVLPR